MTILFLVGENSINGEKFVLPMEMLPNSAGNSILTNLVSRAIMLDCVCIDSFPDFLFTFRNLAIGGKSETFFSINF